MNGALSAPRGCQWWGGGSGARARKETAAFIGEHKAVGGASLHANATRSRCGLRHGRSTAQRGRRRVASARQWRKAVPPPDQWEGSRGLSRGPPTSCTGGAGRGAIPTGRGPASACAYGRYGGMPTRPGASSAATSCARGALALKQINVALFDCLFLPIFELKCSKC
jgi:hypothetical protein